VKLVKSHINSYFKRAGGSLKLQPCIYRSPHNHFQRIYTKVCIKVLNLFEPTPRMTELPKKAIVAITCQMWQHSLWTLQFCDWFPILPAHHRSKKIIPTPRHISPPLSVLYSHQLPIKTLLHARFTPNELAWTAHMEHQGHWIEEYSQNPWRNQIYARTIWFESFIFLISIVYYFPSYSHHMLVTIVTSFMTHFPLLD
jgi:hypothetical protein